MGGFYKTRILFTSMYWSSPSQTTIFGSSVFLLIPKESAKSPHCLMPIKPNTRSRFADAAAFNKLTNFFDFSSDSSSTKVRTIFLSSSLNSFSVSWFMGKAKGNKFCLIKSSKNSPVFWKQEGQDQPAMQGNAILLIKKSKGWPV